MPITPKQNFRYPSIRWRKAIKKTERMRAAGWSVDMTMIIAHAVDEFLDQPEEVIAAKLKLDHVVGEAPIRRTAWGRDAS
jgi:hypothetical protein